MSRENIKKLRAFAKINFETDKTVGIMKTYNNRWFFSLSGYDIVVGKDSPEHARVNHDLKHYICKLLKRNAERVFLSWDTITFFKDFDKKNKKYVFFLKNPLTMLVLEQNRIAFSKRLFSCVERKLLAKNHNKKNIIWVTKQPCINCQEAITYYHVTYQH